MENKPVVSAQVFKQPTGRKLPSGSTNSPKLFSAPDPASQRRISIENGRQLNKKDISQRPSIAAIERKFSASKYSIYCHWGKCQISDISLATTNTHVMILCPSQLYSYIDYRCDDEKKKKKLVSCWRDILVSLRSWRLQDSKNADDWPSPSSCSSANSKKLSCMDCQSPTSTSQDSPFFGK